MNKDKQVKSTPAPAPQAHTPTPTPYDQRIADIEASPHTTADERMELSALRHRQSGYIEASSQHITTIALLTRYKQALMGLVTAGGSEFVDEPEKCGEFVLKTLNSYSDKRRKDGATIQQHIATIKALTEALELCAERFPLQSSMRLQIDHALAQAKLEVKG